MAGHVVSVGDLVLDIVLPVRLPVVGGEHQEPASRQVEPGGAANFLFAARHMGLHVSAAGAVGADVFGQLILDTLRAEGINTTHILAMPGSTTTLVIALADVTTGQHTFLGHYGTGEDVPYPTGLDATIAAADLLFVMGYTFAEKRVVPMALRALDRARQVGIPVYLDVGPFMAAVSPELVQHITARADLILMTEDEVGLVSEGRAGDEAYAYLMARGPHTLIVKQGASGCTVMTRDGQTHVPGYPAEVVDTIGAGDCFAAAFVAGRLNGLSLADAARLANAMGAATVQKAGAGRNAPTCAEVLAVLERAGERLDFRCAQDST